PDSNPPLFMVDDNKTVCAWVVRMTAVINSNTVANVNKLNLNLFDISFEVGIFYNCFGIAHRQPVTVS
ncbi:MAG: hypothetical protein ACKOKF_09025, partial [Bacteroidota bacterium]